MLVTSSCQHVPFGPRRTLHEHARNTALEPTVPEKFESDPTHELHAAEATGVSLTDSRQSSEEPTTTMIVSIFIVFGV